ncbi:MAG: universal stress protein [Ilumatobacteraceae bacterium]
MDVLIAVDDSTESREAVTAAYGFFGSNASYSLISVGERPTLFIGGYGAAAMPTAADIEMQLNAARRTAEHAVSSAETSLPDRAQIDVEVGDPARTICDFAAEQGSDIIVIGSHDRHFWERIFDPSVSRYLIDHAPCPVLVVR